MKKNIKLFMLALIVLSETACQFAINKEQILAAEHLKLSEKEHHFVRFRQIFTEKARGHHKEVIESVKEHLPVHLNNNESLNSLLRLVAGAQRKAIESEAQALVNRNSEWLLRAFIHALKTYVPEVEEWEGEYDEKKALANWQENLEKALSCFANINISGARSLNNLCSDAINCIKLINNDAERFTFVALSGFLLEDAYSQSASDISLNAF